MECLYEHNLRIRYLMHSSLLQTAHTTQDKMAGYASSITVLIWGESFFRIGVQELLACNVSWIHRMNLPPSRDLPNA
jgi:hypothetical protein